MTTEIFRAGVFGAITAWAQANHPGVPVITENGPVPDEKTIGAIWLDCEVRWYGGRNITMGTIPMGRHNGALSAQVYYREAAGTARSDQIVDGLIALLKNARFGGGIMQFPQRTTPTQLRGWYRTGILVPFYLDSP